MYTVGHKKTCHFIWDRNFHVSWWIFTLFAPMKTGRNTLSGNYKICNLPQLCLYTTWENLKTHTTAHFETNCQCILMLNAINGKNEYKWTVFKVCAQNVHPLLAHRLPNDLSIGRQQCQWSAAPVHSRLTADAAEVHQCSQCDAIMTS